LIDANIVSDGQRNVFKFSLKPVEKKSFGRVVELPHNRLIPTPVKVEVWRRDRGQCVQCGSKKNLHFDHDIPFSKGGSSLTAANVRSKLDDRVRLYFVTDHPSTVGETENVPTHGHISIMARIVEKNLGEHFRRAGAHVTTSRWGMEATREVQKFEEAGLALR